MIFAIIEKRVKEDSGEMVTFFQHGNNNSTIDLGGNNMVLACHNLKKAFLEQVIVKNGSFHIEEHEKAALVGLNGAGKSTILKMIMREANLM